MKTWKNKLSAIVFLACGFVGVPLGGGGGAAGLVLVAVFAVPLFFAGVFWIY